MSVSILLQLSFAFITSHSAIQKQNYLIIIFNIAEAILKYSL